MISSSETESFSASESVALGQTLVPSHASEPFIGSTKIGSPEVRVIESQAPVELYEFEASGNVQPCIAPM